MTLKTGKQVHVTLGNCVEREPWKHKQYGTMIGWKFVAEDDAGNKHLIEFNSKPTNDEGEEVVVEPGNDFYFTPNGKTFDLRRGGKKFVFQKGKRSFTPDDDYEGSSELAEAGAEDIDALAGGKAGAAVANGHDTSDTFSPKKKRPKGMSFERMDELNDIARAMVSQARHGLKEVSDDAIMAAINSRWSTLFIQEAAYGVTIGLDESEPVKAQPGQPEQGSDGIPDDLGDPAPEGFEESAGEDEIPFAWLAPLLAGLVGMGQFVA